MGDCVVTVVIHRSAVSRRAGPGGRKPPPRLHPTPPTPRGAEGPFSVERFSAGPDARGTLACSSKIYDSTLYAIAT